MLCSIWFILFSFVLMASEINKLMTRVSIVFFVELKFHEIMPHRLGEEKILILIWQKNTHEIIIFDERKPRFVSFFYIVCNIFFKGRREVEWVNIFFRSAHNAPHLLLLFSKYEMGFFREIICFSFHENHAYLSYLKKCFPSHSSSSFFRSIIPKFLIKVWGF